MKKLFQLFVGYLAIMLFSFAQSCGAVQCFAKVKYSALVSDMRGKLNGSVASRNRGGAYLRNKTTPLNPQSNYQTNVRNYFSDVAKAWRGLLAEERTAWNSAVSGFITTDVFGDGLTPSGSNLHQKLNLNLKNIGVAVITTPPTPAAVPTFATLSLAIAKGAGTATIAFTPAIAATEKVLLYATPGMSPGKTFAKNDYRLIGILTSADVTPENIKSAYETKFGTIPAAGQKVFVKIKEITILSGLQSAVRTASTIVAP